MDKAACAVALLVLDVARRFLWLRRVSFRGQHVLVTGGSQGIGKELAAQLLAKGARCGRGRGG